MANEVSVDVKINGLATNTKQIQDFDKSLSSLNKTSASSASSMKSLESVGASLTTMFKGVASAAIAVGSVIVGAFAVKEVVAAAIESENSINRMNLSLAAVGEYSKQSSKSMQDFATQMQKTTRFSDDQILSSASLLSTLTNLNVDGLQKGTKAAADLAAALGIDLETAATLVAKSIEGNSGALGRYGIRVKEGTTETERFNNTLEALSKVQGRAEADSNTFGGSLIKLRNSFDDTLESIGKVIIENPIFIAAINKASDVIFDFSEYVLENKDNLIEMTNKGIIGLTNALKALTPFLNGIVTIFNNLIGIVRLVVQGWKELIDLAGGFSIFKSVFNGIIDGLAGVGIVTLRVVKIFTDLAANSSILKTAFDKAGISVNGMAGSVDDAITSLRGYREAAIKTDVSKELVSGLKGVDAVLAKTQETATASENVLVTTNKMLSTVTQASRKTLEVVNGTKKATEDISGIGKVTKAYEKLLEDIAGAEQSATGKIEAEYDKRWETAQAYLKLYPKKQKEVNQLLEDINGDYFDKISEQMAKENEEFRKYRQDQINFAKNNPLSIIIDKISTKEKARIRVDIAPQILGGLEGLGNALLKGADGAADILTSGAQGAINMLAPGLGDALKPFMDMFAKGPEFADKAIRAFVAQIPVVIKNVIDSIPAVINAFIQSIPQIVGPLVSTLGIQLADPMFWTKIAINASIEFVRQIPNIVMGIVKGIGDGLSNMFKNLGDIGGALGSAATAITDAGKTMFSWVRSAGESLANLIISSVKIFYEKIIKGAGDFVSELIKKIPVVGNLLGGGGISGGIGGSIIGGLVGGPLGSVAGAIGSVFGFSKGGLPLYAQKGMFTPKGTDTVPSMLTPGELVVDRSTTRKLQNFLDTTPSNNNNNGNNEITNTLLAKVISLLEKPTTVETSVTLNNKTMADIILNLNRTNARLA